MGNIENNSSFGKENLRKLNFVVEAFTIVDENGLERIYLAVDLIPDEEVFVNVFPDKEGNKQTEIDMEIKDYSPELICKRFKENEYDQRRLSSLGRLKNTNVFFYLLNDLYINKKKFNNDFTYVGDETYVKKDLGKAFMSIERLFELSRENPVSMELIQKISKGNTNSENSIRIDDINQ